MRSWSDEWKHAQLQLRLRDDELFHGETVALFVDVHVPSDPHGASTKGRNDGDPSAPTSPTASLAAATVTLRQRWRKQCESARVEIRVVDESGTPSKPKVPRTTLFHQDAQLELVQEADKSECLSGAEDNEKGSVDSSKVSTLAFRSEILLKVRSEYWNRPLKLLVRITPPASVRNGGSMAPSGHDTTLSSFALMDPLESPTFFLTEQFQQDHVLRLIREETMVPEPLTRSVERQICVAKPLQLKMETRYLSKERVCIIAKATNTHAHLELKILDLQLHLNESYATSTIDANSTGTRSGQLKAQSTVMPRRPQRQFRIVNDAQEQFPIHICGSEQFNFLFILEAIETKDSFDVGEDYNGVDDGASETESRFGDVQEERASSMSKRRAPTGGVMKRHSSSSVISTSSSSNPVAGVAKSIKRLTAGQTQQTLLTLSWEASATNSTGDERRLSSPITEYHTIIWSPQSLSIDVRQEHSPWVTVSSPLSVSAFTELLASNENSVADVSTVYLDKQCALSMSLAPLSSSSSPQAGITVGEVVTLCLVIANRSQHTSYDLTLLAPFAPHSAAAAGPQEHGQTQCRGHEHKDDVRGPGWLSFEATHRLGVVPPGMTVRKSVRVVFVRSGKCDLNRFALFDRISRTCFLPPTASASSSASATASVAALAATSAAGAWEVFVKS